MSAGTFQVTGTSNGKRRYCQSNAVEELWMLKPIVWVATPCNGLAALSLLCKATRATKTDIWPMCRTAKEVKSAQFILIDDSSTEDVSAAVETGRQLKHLFKTNFLYIKNSETMGHAASCNIGAEATNAEYIAIVDSSVSGINGWLFTLMATVQSSGRIGMVIMPSPECILHIALAGAARQLMVSHWHCPA